MVEDLATLVAKSRSHVSAAGLLVLVKGGTVSGSGLHDGSCFGPAETM